MARIRYFRDGKTAKILPIPRGNHARQHKIDKLPVTFERRELDALLFLYGRMVKAGEWRDYALDSLSESALFSVFRRSQERPVYCVGKLPKERRQGAYALYDASGRILRRSSSLGLLIRFLEQRVTRA